MNNLADIEAYENFPIKIAVLAILVSIISYIIGAYILKQLPYGLYFAVIYLIYCLCMELMIVFRSCKNCYYHGKVCGLGKGRIAPLFTKKGDPKKFTDRDMSTFSLIPDFLVVIIPIVAAVYLLLTSFSWTILILLFVLGVLFFGGTGMIRGNFACKYCKQRILGCPADKIFNKEKQSKK